MDKLNVQVGWRRFLYKSVVWKCPYIKEAKSLRINQNEWKINQSLNCEISNCVYLIECKKDNCDMKYIGETKRMLKFRLAEHRGYINNQDETQATGKHFNSLESLTHCTEA